MPRYGVTVKSLLAAGFALFALFLFDAGFAPMAVALLLAALAFGYAAWREQRRPQAPSGTVEMAARPPSLRTTLVVCAALLAIDVVFFGAPMLGAYTAIALLLWLLPRIFLAWRKPGLRRHRALVALLTLGMIATDISIYRIYDNIARARVLEVAEELLRYKARTGAFPEKLEQLVPEYLPAVPVAKPGLVMLNGIWYLHKSPGPTGLMYVSFPPYGRHIYDVDKREWTDID